MTFLKRYKLHLQIIALLIIIILWASASWDILYLTLKDKISKNLMRIIHIILIFIIIKILLRTTEPGKYIDNKIFKRKSKR